MADADHGNDRERPDIVLILADDLGYSDLGCYGGEIRTPTLDRLATGGVRMTRFYNTPRCSPSRASLLTGQHPHQAGIGILDIDNSPRGYTGTLNDRCVTAAEIFREAGYATCMSGKWHLASEKREPNDAWPSRRGFDHFFGTLAGCCSYYHPTTLFRGEQNVEVEALRKDFFYTDAIADEASSFISRHHERSPQQPFFLYTAFTAPHWPLHAPEEDVREYAGVFDDGWDHLRSERLRRMVELGVLPEGTRLSERDPSLPPWEDASDKAWQIRRMQVYAAMVQRMDEGIRRMVAALEETGRLDNTIIVFLSDNGASADPVPLIELERFRQRTEILRQETRDGRPVKIGNDPTVMPGPEDTYGSYGRAWANLSNTPFRKYKIWTHEGGIASPFIFHWPAGAVAEGDLIATPYQLIHVLPTLLEAAGVAYPNEYHGREVLPLNGTSMLPALRGAGDVPTQPLFWEHVGNCAVQMGRWKLVREYDWPWELYDLESDHTELEDMAEQEPETVAQLSSSWERWATEVGVIPFREILALYRERGLGWTDAIG